MSRRGAAGRRLRALLIATAVLCAVSSVLCRTNCPRPDADCFYAAFAARVQPRSGTKPVFKPLSASGPSANAASTVDSTGAWLPWSWSSYHSQPVMLDFLLRLVNSSAGTCRLDWLSPTSVEGRHIVAVVVGTDDEGNSNSSAQLPKPRFTWIGNMHGDETANRELLLRLAGEMCSGELAAGDERWRQLQATTVVSIIPTMNPDGYALKTRYNARGVDLNRNFLTSAFPYAPPPADLALSKDAQGKPEYPAAASWATVGNSSLQPEAQAVSSYLSYMPPDLSANLHGGALVANYPLDACDSLGVSRWCPTREEPLPGLLASAYAGSNPGMAANSAPPFANGTVQGAAWYPVLGSLQDWVYHALQRLHITLELHPVKDPPASSLPSLWDANRAAMLRLMELTRMGLRARVVDAATRGSLAANVTVVQPPGVRATAADAARGGYFFKPMAPGIEYEFVVQPYDPKDTGVKYDAISFRVSLPAGPSAVMSGQASLSDLSVERLLMAFRSNGTSAVRK